jgi:putative transposase
MRPVIRYSEAFKLKVVRDLEEGRYGNPTEAGLAHGVTGKGTVARWVRQYGKNHLLRKVVVVMKADEQAEVRALRKRVRDLEKALADAHLDAKIAAVQLGLACKAAGVDDVEAFKKKTRWWTVNAVADDPEARCSVKVLCDRVGMSRQNYYAARRLRKRREIDEGLVLELVRRERRMQPRLGGRKLLHLIERDLEEAGVSIGRDRFFELLAEHDMLVEPRRGTPRTTCSRHCLPVFRNLLAGMALTGPNQAWVSDLTYIRTAEGFLYAALITDAWSRKIVGFHIGDSLEAEGCLAALDMALADLPGGMHPVHHSDRGCQYASHLYVGRLQGRGLPVSMTETMHCYENAKAERVNGILKQEYEMGATFRTKRQAAGAFEQAVQLYNHRRPHTSLGYRFPADVHAEVA